jgi:hypothetical protein
MAPTPPERPSPERPQSDQPSSAREEHSGPLTIERMVKEDGRALILYTHEEREPT